MKAKRISSLDNSALDRKNILNNPFAIQHIQKEVGIRGYRFEGDYKYTLRQISSFFGVESRTIENYLSTHRKELEQNGYEVLTGNRLDSFKKEFDTEISFGIKTRRLGLFNFKAFLNLGMLLKESETARMLRSLILDIVIDVVSKKAGGSTKYINQRDEDYLIALYVGENYRKEFLDALKKYVEMGNFKYAVYTDKIYNCIFKERAGEYRNILNLTKKENVRDTMYSEVLTTISMFETGLAYELKKEYEKLKHKLSPEEMANVFKAFETNPTWKPQIEVVRMKMASRDYGLRSIIHPELTNYIQPLDIAEFNRFLGKKSKELAERIKEYQNVFKRLKDK